MNDAHYLASLCNLIGARTGLMVEWSDKTSFATDGKRVIFPHRAVDMIAETHPNGPHAGRQAVIGLVIHEVGGHVQQTDFAARAKSPLANSLLNLLEDIRIEQNCSLMFAGYRQALNESANWAQERYWRAETLPNDLASFQRSDAYNAVGFWLMRRLRSEWLGQTLDAAQVQALQSILQGLGIFDVAQQCHKIATSALLKARSTADLVPAAEEIARLLQQMQPGQDQPPQSDDQEADGEQSAKGPNEQAEPQERPSSAPGDEDAASAAGEDGSNAQASSDAQGDERSAGEPQGDADGNDTDDGPEAGDGSATQPTWDPEPDAAIAQTDLGEMVAQEAGCTREVTSNKQIGQGGMPIFYDTPVDLSARERQMMRRIACVLRDGLRERFVSLVEDEDDALATCGTALDGSSLVAAYRGWRRDVFVEPGSPAPGLNLNLVLMVDVSGSTSGTIADTIRASTLGIIDAAANFPGAVKVSLVCFNGGAQSASGSHQAVRNAAMRYRVGGCTSWILGYLKASTLLSRTRQNVVLTITDGELGRIDNVMLAKEAQHVFVSVGVTQATPAGSVMLHAKPDDPDEIARAILAGVKVAL